MGWMGISQVRFDTRAITNLREEGYKRINGNRNDSENRARPIRRFPKLYSSVGPNIPKSQSCIAPSHRESQALHYQCASCPIVPDRRTEGWARFQRRRGRGQFLFFLPKRCAPFAVLCLVATSAFAGDSLKNFITAHDGKLFDGTHEFRFMSMDIPNLLGDRGQRAVRGRKPLAISGPV